MRATAAPGIALVPTMGYLHEGHLSLMREARRRADSGGARGLSLATIFVNPTQFGPTEDLARYPRDLEGDLAKCARGRRRLGARAGATRRRCTRRASRPGWTVERGLAGAVRRRARPGHFRGVATVVAKLFGLSRPHVALFGEKDWQQLAGHPAAWSATSTSGIEVVGMPIVREPDGLALSLAQRLPLARRAACARWPSRARSREAREAAAAGASGTRPSWRRARARLEAAGVAVDYVELVHPETLGRCSGAEPGTRMLLAAFLGTTRLIDNAGACREEGEGPGRPTTA